MRKVQRNITKQIKVRSRQNRRETFKRNECRVEEKKKGSLSCNKLAKKLNMLNLEKNNTQKLLPTAGQYRVLNEYEFSIFTSVPLSLKNFKKSQITL
jgi:hypothetical protein